jgi:Tfp pilus assembly protein PilV
MLVASGVFVVSVLVLFGIFPISARSVRQAEHRLIAVHLASNRLELVRGQSPERLQSEPPAVSTVSFRHQGELVTQAYEIEQVVTPPLSANAKLREVRVIVRWEADNRKQELKMETQIASLAP